jgi:hypothetical protein
VYAASIYKLDLKYSMKSPLMPKATAVWLVTNTALTFEQIADFCIMHPLEVQGIADGEVAIGIIAEDPIVNGQLTQEEIDRCAKDSSARLQITDVNKVLLKINKKKTQKYTPIARRQDKPDAIAWLVKNYPDMSDAKIAKLIGTTKTTVTAIKKKEHWNYDNLRARDPVLLGLCTQTLLNEAVASIKPKNKA